MIAKAGQPLVSSATAISTGLLRSYSSTTDREGRPAACEQRDCHLDRLAPVVLEHHFPPILRRRAVISSLRLEYRSHEQVPLGTALAESRTGILASSTRKGLTELCVHLVRIKSLPPQNPCHVLDHHVPRALGIGTTLRRWRGLDREPRERRRNLLSANNEALKPRTSLLPGPKLSSLLGKFAPRLQDLDLAFLVRATQPIEPRIGARLDALPQEPS